MQHVTIKKYVAVTFLALAVVLAGCTGGGEDEPVEANETQQVSVTQNDGLSVRFSSQQAAYREGEPIMLELNLENTGQKMANGITTRLTGASFIAGVPPQFPGRASLRPVDQAANRPGDETRVRWQISNPVNLDNGFVESFPATARVGYNYQTTARGAFTAVSGKNFDGEGSQITTRTSAGPLSVEIDVESPMPIYPSGNPQTEIPVSIRVTNRGDGMVANIVGDRQPIHVQNVGFPNTDKATLSCPPTLSLYDGTGRLDCTARLPSDVIEEQFTMQIDLAYGYFESQELSFQIEGIEGDRSAQ